jgi:hypothetical protein
MRKSAPNPAGNKGKPFTLAPMKFDDALRKILATPPEPKPAKAARKNTHGRSARVSLNRVQIAIQLDQ